MSLYASHMLRLREIDQVGNGLTWSWHRHVGIRQNNNDRGTIFMDGVK